MIKKIFNIFFRYFLLFFSSLNNLYLFYLIFTPLTVYPIYGILSLFYNLSLSGTTIFIGELSISLIPACIAGSAYFLLLMLNLSNPMSAKQRLYSILFSFSFLLLLNMLRILLLSVLFIEGISSFETIHYFSWHALSILFVIGIWFSTVKLYHIKNIPLYDDIRTILKINS